MPTEFQPQSQDKSIDTAKGTVRLERITKRFGDVSAVNNFNLKVQQGEFLVLLGPSGCGKTTTLRMIAGLETPSDGEIYISDQNVTNSLPQNRDLSMTFQNYALYPHKTVQQNLEFPLNKMDLDKEAKDEKIHRTAELLEIDDLLAKYPSELSGGQRQRVAVGRTIVREPQVFLMDEPLSNLDAKLRVNARTRIRSLQQNLETTTIYVTHDQEEAMSIADRIAIMNNGQLEQIGTPKDIYENPDNEFVAGFLGEPRMNFLDIDWSPAGITLFGEEPITISTDAPGDTQRMGIRPENIHFAGNSEQVETTEAISMETILIEPLGNTYEVVFSYGSTELTSLMTDLRSISEGDEIDIVLRAIRFISLIPEGTLSLMEDMMAELKFQNVTKRYNDAQGVEAAVNEVSFSVSDGELLVLVGPSGCGKSTTLRLIAGLESVTEGQILLNGTEIQHLSASERSVAMVFQEYALYSKMTARENIGYGLKHSTDYSRAEIREAVEDSAAMLGITDLLENYPAQLSGGQKQRVALGRAIVRDPDIFLLDEPLSNLDAKLRAQMRSELQRIQNNLGTTMIYVTHDQKEAMTMADRVVILNDGKVQQISPPEEAYHEPNNEFVATFFGNPAMNILENSLQQNDTTVSLLYQETTIAEFKMEELDRISDGEPLKLGIRPEDIELGDPSTGTLMGKTDVVEYQGNESYLSIAVGNKQVRARYSGDQEFTEGTKIGVSFPKSKLHLFKQNGDNIRKIVQDSSKE